MIMTEARTNELGLQRAPRLVSTPYLNRRSCKGTKARKILFRSDIRAVAIGKEGESQSSRLNMDLLQLEMELGGSLKCRIKSGEETGKLIPSAILFW